MVVVNGIYMRESVASYAASEDDGVMREKVKRKHVWIHKMG